MSHQGWGWDTQGITGVSFEAEGEAGTVGKSLYSGFHGKERVRQDQPAYHQLIQLSSASSGVSGLCLTRGLGY